jgi:S1-C subfamily serine protease
MTKSRHKFHLSTALFLLLCAVSLDYLVLSVRADSTAVAGSNRAALSAKTNSSLSPTDLSECVHDAVDKIRDSLVTIHGGSPGSSRPVLPPLLPEFSDGDFNNFNDLSPLPDIVGTDMNRTGVATGVIVTEDGFVWTSHDVVQGLDSVTVTLQDDTTYAGKVILSDQESGLGIVKIDAQKLPAAKFGETGNLKPADWAVAVALDDCHQPSLAAGMISSLKRPKSAADIRIIRCAFPIESDFLGCAVINLDGDLIGISSSLAAKRDGSFTACRALDCGSAKELHRKATQEVTVTSNEETEQAASSVETMSPDKSIQTGKEVKPKHEGVSRLLSEFGSAWNIGSIPSSFRNWIGIWQNASHPLPYSAPHASESR